MKKGSSSKVISQNIGAEMKKLLVNVISPADGPFCVDCEFLNKETCMRPLKPYVDLVTGKLKKPVAIHNAYYEREDHPGRCGPEGRFFSPK